MRRGRRWRPRAELRCATCRRAVPEIDVPHLRPILGRRDLQPAFDGFRDLAVRPFHDEVPDEWFQVLDGDPGDDCLRAKPLYRCSLGVHALAEHAACPALTTSPARMRAGTIARAGTGTKRYARERFPADERFQCAMRCCCCCCRVARSFRLPTRDRVQARRMRGDAKRTPTSSSEGRRALRKPMRVGSRRRALTQAHPPGAREVSRGCPAGARSGRRTFACTTLAPSHPRQR
jgi:hypothetical protein